MDQIIRIGMDTSKHFFQLHGVDAAERPVLRRKLRRHEVLAFFAKQPPTVIGMETQHRSHRSQCLSVQQPPPEDRFPPFAEAEGVNDLQDRNPEGRKVFRQATWAVRAHEGW